MVSRNTTLVPSLGLRIGPTCEAGLSAGMRTERVPPQRRKKEEEKDTLGLFGETTGVLPPVLYMFRKLCHGQHVYAADSADIAFTLNPQKVIELQSCRL